MQTRLIKSDTQTGKEWDYGYMTEKDIKLQTRGYKFDKEFGVFTRKGSKYGFYIIEEGNKVE